MEELAHIFHQVLIRTQLYYLGFQLTPPLALPYELPHALLQGLVFLYELRDLFALAAVNFVQLLLIVLQLL